MAQTSLGGGASIGLTGLYTPCVNFPDSITSLIRLNIPMPSDWDGSPMNFRTCYSSNGLSGDFDVFISGNGLIFENPNTQNFLDVNLITGPPVEINALKKVDAEIKFPNSPEPPNYVNITLRRQATSADDSSSHVMQIMGFVLEYNSNQ